MNSAATWSDARDARLQTLRAEGATWRDIAASLDVTRWSAIERGRRIGAPAPAPPRFAETADDLRKPLPPGHPSTWGAITDGTLLDGAAYPYPIFL